MEKRNATIPVGLKLNKANGICILDKMLDEQLATTVLLIIMSARTSTAVFNWTR